MAESADASNTVPRGEFFEFLQAAGHDPWLGKACFAAIRNSTPEALSDWFQERGFQITIEECIKLIENKEYFQSKKHLDAMADNY